MNMEKTIIIMAKSFKHNNYCIAGIDIETGEWIRPVSDNNNLEGAVLIEDTVYQNGNEVQLFDVVTIQFIKYYPKKAQHENYLYDSKRKWVYKGSVTLNYVIKKFGVDSENFIFGNTLKSLNEKALTGKSLMLVQIHNPAIWVKRYPERTAITLSFTYACNSYTFIPVSDIGLHENYINLLDGKYELGTSRYAVFSLTDSFSDGKYYKMLAQLF